MEKIDKETKNIILKKIIAVFAAGNYELKKYYQLVNEKGELTEKVFRVPITSLLDEVNMCTLNMDYFPEYKYKSPKKEEYKKWQ